MQLCIWFGWNTYPLLSVYYVSFAGLPRLDPARPSLRDLMIRLSLLNDSNSSRAALYSLLSLSAVHRYGDTVKAARFKNLALQALRKASRAAPLDIVQVQQHIAASLMLCRVEVRPCGTT